MKKTLLAVSILSAFSGGWAQGAEPLFFEMDEFIVVGHKIKKEDPHASINIEEKIDAGQLHTAADILENVPGMVVSRGQNSGIQVGMRGLNHERTVIAINGNVVDNIGEIMQGRALEWDALPITNIKQMQIIRGGRSAMYGGALAGVINIITDDDNIKPESKLRFSYGSWNTWKSTFSNQGKSDNQKLSWSLALSKQESDGYYRNTSSNGHDGSINLSYNLNDTDKIRLLYSHVYKREGMAVGNNKAKNPASKYLGFDPDYPTTPNLPALQVDGYRQWKTDDISLHYETKDSHFSFYDYRQNRLDHAQRMIPGRRGPPRLGQMEIIWDADIINRGLNWDQQKKTGKHDLNYGLQYKVMKFHIKNEFSRYRLPAHALFIEDNYTAGERTTIGMGLRYDHQKFTAEQGGIRKDSYHHLSPKMNITQKLSDGSYLFAGASMLFRAPTVADYSRWSTGYIDRDGDYRNEFFPGSSIPDWQKFLGTPKPEKGMSYELGWKKSLHDNANLQITGFYYDIDDYLNISFGKAHLKPPIVYNIDNVKVRGIEIMGSYQLNENWSLTAGYTYQKSKKEGDRMNAALRNLPESTFKSGVYYNNFHGFRSALNLRFIGKAKAEDPSSALPSYTIADATFSYEKGSHLISLAVNNIFNRYYEESRGFRMPGTNYSVSYQYRF